MTRSLVPGALRNRTHAQVRCEMLEGKLLLTGDLPALEAVETLERPAPIELEIVAPEFEVELAVEPEVIGEVDPETGRPLQPMTITALEIDGEEFSSPLVLPGPDSEDMAQLMVMSGVRGEFPERPIPEDLEFVNPEGEVLELTSIAVEAGEIEPGFSVTFDGEPVEPVRFLASNDTLPVEAMMYRLTDDGSLTDADMAAFSGLRETSDEITITSDGEVLEVTADGVEIAEIPVPEVTFDFAGRSMDDGPLPPVMGPDGPLADVDLAAFSGLRETSGEITITSDGEVLEVTADGVEITEVPVPEVTFDFAGRNLDGVLFTPLVGSDGPLMAADLAAFSGLGQTGQDDGPGRRILGDGLRTIRTDSTPVLLDGPVSETIEARINSLRLNVIGDSESVTITESTTTDTDRGGRPDWTVPTFRSTFLSAFPERVRSARGVDPASNPVTIETVRSIAEPTRLPESFMSLFAAGRPESVSFFRPFVADTDAESADKADRGDSESTQSVRSRIIEAMARRTGA